MRNSNVASKLICPKLIAQYQNEAHSLGLTGHSCEQYVKTYQSTPHYQLCKIWDNLIKVIEAFRDGWK